MSHLLLSNEPSAGHVGPDEFIQLVYRNTPTNYRNTATNAADIDSDPVITARRRRRVSSTYLLTSYIAVKLS